MQGMNINDVTAALPDMPPEDVRALFDAVSAEYQTLPYRDTLQRERARAQVVTVQELRASGAVTSPVGTGDEDGVFQFVSGTVYLPGETVEVDGARFTLAGVSPSSKSPAEGAPWEPATSGEEDDQ